MLVPPWITLLAQGLHETNLNQWDQSTLPQNKAKPDRGILQNHLPFKGTGSGSMIMGGHVVWWEGKPVEPIYQKQDSKTDTKKKRIGDFLMPCFMDSIKPIVNPVEPKTRHEDVDLQVTS